MAYNPDIPQASDDPSQSQSQLLANFQELNTFLTVNHVSLNDGDEGKHKFLQMPTQSSAPTTGAAEGGLYAKDVSGTPELFYRKESDGSELQLTTAYTAASSGQITFAGGLTMKWGVSSFSGSGTSVNVTYATPFASTGYNVVASLVGGQSAFSVSNTSSATGFTMARSSSSPSGQSFHWIAIGI